MVHIPEYSLVIRPPQPIIEYVAALKLQLREEIKNFGSANAQAHLTVFNFDANTEELEIWKTKIQQFCQRAMPATVTFDYFDAFPPHTFFIAPDDSSAHYLNALIKDFHRYINVKPQAHAHMSIARRLDTERLGQAQALFRNEPVHFSFVCESFVLRKFNPKELQYSEIVAKFEFNGQANPTLFD